MLTFETACKRLTKAIEDLIAVEKEIECWGASENAAAHLLAAKRHAVECASAAYLAAD